MIDTIGDFRKIHISIYIAILFSRFVFVDISGWPIVKALILFVQDEGTLVLAHFLIINIIYSIL
jgi:hypothetical protein